MFVRLSSGHHNRYADGNGGLFLWKGRPCVCVCVNLLPHRNINPTLRIQVGISPLMNPLNPKSGFNPVEERVLAPQSEFKFPFLSLVP